MTNKLTRQDLYSLEEYSEKRNEIRKRILAHKQDRHVMLGDHVLLSFEDRELMQYQIQEMLRTEKIFDAEGINEELDAYNPLIPDGTNWKATMMIQFTDVDERQQQLARLIGIEDLVWVQVEGHDKVYAIADEDLERDNAEKTSAVHFLRFELSPDMIESVKTGAEVSAGVEHENYYAAANPLAKNIRDSLANDLAFKLAS